MIEEESVSHHLPSKSLLLVNEPDKTFEKVFQPSNKALLVNFYYWTGMACVEIRKFHLVSTKNTSLDITFVS